MTNRERLRWSVLAVSILAAGACVSAEPAVLSLQFVAPAGAAWSHKALPGQAVCRVAVAEVRDMRSDVVSMGEMAGRPVRAEDSAAWLASAFASLDQDARLRLLSPGTAEGADLVLNVELLKAYLSTITTDKAANVVVRVRYSRNDMALGEQVFRGNDNGMNWASGDLEAQDTLNNALREVIAAVDEDVHARCSAAIAGPSLSTRR